MSIVGVLALQGDFAEHAAILRRLDADAREIRLPSDLEGVDRLIIPGGESTTIARLMEMYGLVEPIRAFAAHRPVWGTCAGMIVMARRATDLDRETLGLMDVSVVRNAFGRQLDSFETDLEIEELPGPPLHAVFIRAPLIKDAGPAVKVMARIDGKGIVAAREGHLLATAFHPELTGDTRMHQYFLTLGGEVSSVK
ncbi:MAG TPA: pyridoxal 5'-phosphate synthase glutaminase subunit PdxT [Dehalococcoidia bacterium]|nr:pyridoxal 5'-phosphate synthase glutaminase subunit PdxT [Dehalococcoidia bacterium]